MRNGFDVDGKVERRGRCRLPPRNMACRSEPSVPDRQVLRAVRETEEAARRRREGRSIATSFDL